MNWRDEETMEAAAVRLLRVLNERAEKRKVAGHLEAPAEILDQPQSLAEKRPADERNKGLASRQSAGQFTDAEGGADSSGWGASGVSGEDCSRISEEPEMRPLATSADSNLRNGFTKLPAGVNAARWGKG